MEWLAFASHVLRHPCALLPGAPKGIVNSARHWVEEQRRSSPADIRRGPPAAVSTLDEPGMTVYSRPRSINRGAVEPLRIFPDRGTCLYFFTRARVISNEGVVISSDNMVFSEFTYVDSPGGIHSHPIFRRRRFTRPVALAGCYSTLCYPSSPAYAHWMVESLPRLRLLEPYIDALHGIFVPASLPATLMQSLKVFGVRPEQLVPLDVTSHYAPEHLLVPAYCAGLDIPTWVPRYLRGRVSGRSGSAAPTRRLYVSRARVSRRRLLNEPEILPILRKWDFEVVHPQELGFLEQARLFHEANVVMGPSGAGMFNAMFSQPGGTMIELAPREDLAGHYYYSVAAATGLTYWSVPGSTPAPGEGSVEHRDFFIDAQSLAATLEQALAHPPEIVSP